MTNKEMTKAIQAIEGGVMKKPIPEYKGQELIWRISEGIDSNRILKVNEICTIHLDKHYIADTYTNDPESKLYWKRVFKTKEIE